MSGATGGDTSPTFRGSKLIANFGATAVKKGTTDSEPEVRSLRYIRSMLASLGLLDKEVKKVAPDSRRERLQKRVLDLMKALQLCRSSLQTIHTANATEALLPLDVSGCSYCGCTCKSRSVATFPSPCQLRAIDLRSVLQRTRCSVCSRLLLSDSNVCEECKVSSDYKTDDGGVSLYVKAQVMFTADQTNLLPRLSLSPLTSRRLLTVKTGKARSISPDPRYLLPVTTRPVLKKAEFTQTDPQSAVVTLSVGENLTQFSGLGPHVCRLVLKDFPQQGEATHKRSTTDSSQRRPPLLTCLQGILDQGDACIVEAETLVTEQVNAMEQTKQHFLLPGVADRTLERLLRIFGRLEAALKPVLPTFVSALEIVMSGVMLTCEAVSASHYEVLSSLEAQKSAEKEAQVRGLSEQVVRLQSELVSCRFTSTSEIAALKHTIHSYEQRLQTLFAAFKSSKAL